LGEALDRTRWVELVLACTLSIIFTISLFYLTFEIPRFLDEILRQYFPDVFYDIEAREGILGMLRPVGYSAMAITIALVALGFAIRRGSMAFLGSLALYIPTFGYFAFAMFFLAGLGVLRVLWLPILDLSPSILTLGCIAYVPLLPLLSTPYIYVVGMAITFAGLLVFSLGVATWLYGRFRGCEIVDFWMYRYSRHPQYLGYILWSYGLLVFISFKSYVRGAFTTPPSTIWLISTMIVVGIALLEELEMARKLGEKYEEYRRRTPFMIPLPKPLYRIVAWPMRKIVREYPTNAKDVLAIVALYTAILIALSYAILLAITEF